MKKAYKVPDSGGGAACTKPPKEGQEAFSALVFRRRMFERVAREIAPEIRGAKELFSKAGTDVPYLFAKKMRFPKSEDAYVRRSSVWSFWMMQRAAHGCAGFRHPSKHESKAKKRSAITPDIFSVLQCSEGCLNFLSSRRV